MKPSQDAEWLFLIQNDLMYSGQSGTMEQWLRETMIRLPGRIRRFALDRCHFTSVGTVFGLVLPGRIGVRGVRRVNRARTKWGVRVPKRRRTLILPPQWVIVLADKLPPKDAHSIIAHEIAHAWRGDDRLGHPPADCEEETARLTLSWGFIGKGASVSYATRGPSGWKSGRTRGPAGGPSGTSKGP